MLLTKAILLNMLYLFFIQRMICLETKSLDYLIQSYEDDKNAMLAVIEQDETSGDDIELYQDFYDEFDNQLVVEESMNIIFFGPASEFLRIDSETMLQILSLTKKQSIPISKALLAWDVITDGKTSAYLQSIEFEAFDTLLNLVPEEDLYHVNFGDLSVLRYFANNLNKLRKRKVGVLVSAYRRYFGDSWITNSTNINDLGYFICGFPTTDLMKIPPSVFKDIDIDVLNKVKFCNPDQGIALYEIAVHNQAYGKPYSWTAHEISKLGYLFTYIPSDEISSLQIQSVHGITKQVIADLQEYKLGRFSRQQILRMDVETRRTYILKTQHQYSLDVDIVIRSKANKIKPFYFF